MGYIKLFRSIREWGWYDDPNTFTVFLHLLIEANWKDDVEWHGEKVGRGEIITSVAKIAVECGISYKQARLCLDRLSEGGEIVKVGANKWTKITICKYADYQDTDDDLGQTKGEQRANKGQSKGEQRATSKEEKKERKKESVYKYTPEKESSVEDIYVVYPSKCPISGRSTGKGQESRKIIARLLKSRTEETIVALLKKYLADCASTNCYIANFDTTLHRLEKGDFDALPLPQETPKPEPQSKPTFTFIGTPRG